MIKNAVFPGAIGREAVSLVNARPIAAPLIKARFLGTRYDPQGAITPEFGSRVNTPKPIKVERQGNSMKVNNVDFQATSLKLTRKGGGIPNFTIEKQKTSLTDKLTEKIGKVRKATQKGAGIGRNTDFSA
ncbi:MAG: hypothetical protein Q8Q95_03210 [bacterium]|nr:hypothetical protein [bacterium]